MTLTTKSLLASLTLLGVAEGADVPEWATKGLLVLSFAAVQWLGARSMGRLDADLTDVKNTLGTIGDRVTRMEGAVAANTHEINVNVRPHVHEIATKCSAFDARLTSIQDRMNDRRKDSP